MKKTTILLIILSLFGIFFLSILFEEIFHVFTMKGATQICFPTNIKINDSIQTGYVLGFTDFDLSKYDNIEEYNSIRETSEKNVYILTRIFALGLSFLFGYFMGGRK